MNRWMFVHDDSDNEVFSSVFTSSRRRTKLVGLVDTASTGEAVVSVM